MINRGATAERRLLVIEDGPEIGSIIERVAKPFGVETRVVRQLVDVRGAVAGFRPTAIFADLTTNGSRDFGVLRCLSDCGRQAPIVVMSGSGFRRAVETVAANLGLTLEGFIDKPFTLRRLREMLEALSQHDGTRSMRSTKPPFGEHWQEGEMNRIVSLLSEREIYATAKFLIKRYGALTASTNAAMRAKELLNNGDAARAERWQRIEKAAADMACVQPTGAKRRDSRG